MRILLTEGSGLTSRQVAGRLRSAGHEVGVLSCDPIFLTRFTNSTSAWHRVPAFGPDPFGWFDAAVAIYREHGYDLLFPTQEQVTVVAASAERLRRDDIATIVPPFEALAAVQDKVAATATIQRLALPQPPSTILTDRAMVQAFDGFPVFLKLPIGTAGGGVGLVRTRSELDALVAGWDLDEAFAIGGLVAQEPAEGPLAMLQSVFDHGRLVAFHANIRTREGARGGASHKRSVSLPAARDAIERLGHELGWNGALSADVILTTDGPVLIDINPRLVEPNNAWFAGVDLVGTMVALAVDEHPPIVATGREGVATHQLVLAILGAAQHGRGRRGILAELAGAITRRGSYRASREELTPLKGDLQAAAPLALAALVTLARPSMWTWFSSASVSNYALSPRGWREITARQDSLGEELEVHGQSAPRVQPIGGVRRR
jgi:biotin carboxylase